MCVVLLHYLYVDLYHCIIVYTINQPSFYARSYYKLVESRKGDKEFWFFAARPVYPQPKSFSLSIAA